jgi:hypothetical protein
LQVWGPVFLRFKLATLPAKVPGGGIPFCCAIAIKHRVRRAVEMGISIPVLAQRRSSSTGISNLIAEKLSGMDALSNDSV